MFGEKHLNSLKKLQGGLGIWVLEGEKKQRRSLELRAENTPGDDGEAGGDHCRKEAFLKLSQAESFSRTRTKQRGLNFSA